ncbi:MAG: hypothetical protein AAFO98_09690 [Pseudomonadota bacterium]
MNQPKTAGGEAVMPAQFVPNHRAKATHAFDQNDPGAAAHDGHVGSNGEDSVFDTLQAAIETLEGRTKRFSAMDGAEKARWQLGYAPVDAALPDQALAVDACHDITPLKPNDVPQAAGFALALLKRLPRNGPIMWCQTAFNGREYGRIYSPGLLQSGLLEGAHQDPQPAALLADRLFHITVPKDRDLALVLEECVRVSALAAVVGEGPAPDFTASRRLTLAAQVSRVPCLIINTSGAIGASAAATRWRVAPIAGPPDTDDPQGPGQPAWSITLARSRGGDTAQNPTSGQPLEIFWNDATHSFNLVPPFRRGATDAPASADGAQPHGSAKAVLGG